MDQFGTLASVLTVVAFIVTAATVYLRLFVRNELNQLERHITKYIREIENRIIKLETIHEDLPTHSCPGLQHHNDLKFP